MWRDRLNESYRQPITMMLHLRSLGEVHAGIQTRPYMLYGCQRPMHGPGGDGHSIMGVEPGHHQSTTPGCPTRYTPPTHSDRRVSDSDAPFRLVRSCKREERIAAHSPDTGGLVMSARTRDCNSPGRALLLR
jgi:hypothetical protein